jgi:hypothetical protein
VFHLPSTCLRERLKFCGLSVDECGEEKCVRWDGEIFFLKGNFEVFLDVFLSWFRLVQVGSS